MSKKAWSQEEKAQLLLNIIDASCASVDWSRVTLPEGRTQKSCMHVLDKFRKMASGTASNPSSDTASPTKGPKATKSTKRKSDEEGSGGDSDGNERLASSKKKMKKDDARKRNTTDVKKETEDY